MGRVAGSAQQRKWRELRTTTGDNDPSPEGEMRAPAHSALTSRLVPVGREKEKQPDTSCRKRGNGCSTGSPFVCPLRLCSETQQNNLLLPQLRRSKKKTRSLRKHRGGAERREGSLRCNLLPPHSAREAAGSLKKEGEVTAAWETQEGGPPNRAHAAEWRPERRNRTALAAFRNTDPTASPGGTVGEGPPKRVDGYTQAREMRWWGLPSGSLILPPESGGFTSGLWKACVGASRLQTEVAV